MVTAGYTLILLQAIVPIDFLELWKGVVYFNSSLEWLVIPWNLFAALENFLWLCYSFLTLKDYLAVKKAIADALQ